MRALGRSLIARFLVIQVAGDVGEQFVMPEGEVVYRDPEPRDREDANIFGSVTLTRTVFNKGANQNPAHGSHSELFDRKCLSRPRPLRPHRIPAIWVKSL